MRREGKGTGEKEWRTNLDEMRERGMGRKNVVDGFESDESERSVWIGKGRRCRRW